jgi:hypothetical protein
MLSYPRYKIFERRHVPLLTIEGLREDDFNLHFFNKCEQVGNTYRFRRVAPLGIMARIPPFSLINRSEGKITNGVLVVPAEEKVQKVRKGGPSFRVKAGRITKRKAVAKRLVNAEEDVAILDVEAKQNVAGDVKAEQNVATGDVM